MSDKSIIVENISKRYRIGLLEQRADTFAGTLFNYIKYPINNFRRLRSLTSFNDTNNNEETILWALKDVNFEVKEGEVLGIIGKNGAGKSTLLKILSRITLPTGGRAELRGRVSSLLEVGTGFHPELTGRENVYLNGTILGMSKKEINEKFDEIVDFSGIEKFIDTPVKRYSSGMGVRLAFSIAAHLEPEIMIIDEVLAVGDARFQEKCIGKIKNINKGGRTVLFVSHNMTTMSKLCVRAILLDGGRITAEGETEDVINKYLSINENDCNCSKNWSLRDAPGDEFVRLLKVSINGSDGNLSSTFDVQDEIKLELEYKILKKTTSNMCPHFHVYDSLNNCIFVTVDENVSNFNGNIREGNICRGICSIPPNLLNEGTYYINVYVTTREIRKIHFEVEKALSFKIIDLMRPGGARGNIYTGPIKGIIRPLLKWEKEVIN